MAALIGILAMSATLGEVLLELPTALAIGFALVPVALAQINATVGDLAGNAAKIVDAARKYARLRLLVAVFLGRLARCRVYEAYTTRSLSVRSLDGPLRQRLQDDLRELFEQPHGRTLGSDDAAARGHQENAARVAAIPQRARELLEGLHA